MIQGSNMTIGHKGMKKGISLVEMLVAIVLFGIIGTISFTYYKNYYDTSFAAKQIRVYTIVDQASQIGNAFDLYNTKNGADPIDLDKLVVDKELTAVPVAQPFITIDGWELVTDANITGAATGVAFVYAVDAVISNQDKLDYCNILNNTAYSEHNLGKSDLDQNSTYELYAAGDAEGLDETEYFHCSEVNASTYTYQLFFVKRPSVLQ